MFQKKKAEDEERERKLKEEGAMHFFNKFTGEFEKLKKEIAQPDKNQKQEKIKNENKLAIIISNKEYKKTGMADLPPVVDDHANIRQTVLMMGVPDKEENIFEIMDGSWE